MGSNSVVGEPVTGGEFKKREGRGGEKEKIKNGGLEKHPVLEGHYRADDLFTSNQNGLL